MSECEHTWYWDGTGTHCYKCGVRILALVSAAVRERDEAWDKVRLLDADLATAVEALEWIACHHDGAGRAAQEALAAIRGKETK